MIMDRVQTFTTDNWNESFAKPFQTQVIDALENGQLLFFPHLAFTLQANEERFLSHSYVKPKTKNISLNTNTQELRGARILPEETLALKNMLARYTTYATQLVQALFPHYQQHLKVARTSYRPAEISQRCISYRKDDRRLHVDAFPSSPNQGQRILRVFSNVNPHNEDRVWRLGEPFEQVAQHFLPRIHRPIPGVAHCLKLLGITKSYRTAYDHYMLKLHDNMKADNNYQHLANQAELHLPAGSSWIVQTDQVSHAAMRGQYMFEQTFYLPVNAMIDEQRSPLRILEKLVGQPLDTMPT